MNSEQNYFHCWRICSRQKYNLDLDITTLESGLAFSSEYLSSIPKNYQVRADFIANHLCKLADLIFVSTTIYRVQQEVEEALTLRAEVSKSHEQRHSVNLSMCTILSKQYILSHNIKDFSNFVNLALDSIYEYNDKLDITQPKLPSAMIYRLTTCVRKIEGGSPKSMVRDQALDRLYQCYSPVHESRKLLMGILTMQQNHGKEFEVYAKHLDSNVRLSEDKITDEIRLIEQEEAQKIAEQQENAINMRNVQQDNYIDPFFGHRNLALDPNNKRIVLSMEGLVKGILGYEEDDLEPTSWAEFEAREARLERTSFEKEKKEGKNPNPNLCRMCRRTKPLVPLEGGNFTWNRKMWIPFGNHGQLLTRKRCSICRLILSLINVDGTDTLHPRFAQVDPEIQGTQFHVQNLPSGEQILGVEFGMITVGALRILKPENLQTALRHAPQGRNNKLLLENAAELHAHNEERDQKLDGMQLRRCLYQCYENHGELCNGLGKSPRYTSEIPLYLIDVKNRCLVSATSAKKYITLSYVWGSYMIPTTTKANLQLRLQAQSLNPSQLPKTISDAMSLVLAIGEHYLWTDALCIVLDDLIQKKRDIPRMDIVYKKGFANIIAMSGKDANSGLPGVSAGSRPPQQIEVFPILRGSADLALGQNAAAANDNMCLVATPKPLHLAQEGSTWNTRGWILQEQMLASRNIYFSNTNVYFQCPTQVIGETTLGGNFETEDAQTTATVTKNPLAELEKTQDVTKDKRLGLVFKVYSELLEVYMTRKLTQQSDILNAFSGMLSAFTEHFDSGSIIGLPIAALDLALLWTPAGKLAIRKVDQPPQPLTPVVSSSNTATPPSTQNFPTWSWAGWIGPVDYRLFASEKEPLPDSLIGEFYIIQNGQILRLLKYIRANPDPSSKFSDNDLAILFRRQVQISSPSLAAHCLYFSAPCVLGKNFTVDRNRKPDHVSSAKHVHTQTAQAVVRLRDSNGRHCGILFEHTDYHQIFKLVTKGTKQILETMAAFTDKIFIALSKTKDFYDRRPGLMRVEGEIKPFDENEFPSQGPGSALFNILVLNLEPENTFKRIAVGQVHSKTWLEAAPTSTWIKLG